MRHIMFHHKGKFYSVEKKWSWVTIAAVMKRIGVKDYVYSV